MFYDGSQVQRGLLCLRLLGFLAGLDLGVLESDWWAVLAM